jgi:hypothetical protein
MRKNGEVIFFAIMFLIFMQSIAIAQMHRPDFSHLKDLRDVSAIHRVVLDNIPAATQEEITKWNNLVSCPVDAAPALSSLGQCGIAGNDFFGIKQIELSPAESKCAIDTFNEWYPIENPTTPGFGSKRTACGLLVEYGQTGTDWNRAWNIGDVTDCFDQPWGLIHPWLSTDVQCVEDRGGDLVHDKLLCDHDYDLDIKLHPIFQPLVSTISDLTADWRCTTLPEVSCKVHAEIDLPMDVNPSKFSVRAGYPIYAEAGFFAKIAETDQNVCVYGPWVIDDNRLIKREWIPPNELLGRKVEIHPAEQIWYGNRKGALLLSTADYSSRYARFDDFDRSGNFPKIVPFIAWAQTPLQSRFAIAFKIGPGDAPIWYRLQAIAVDNIKAFSTDGQEHELAVRETNETRSLVHVIEQPNGDLADVSFEEVRRTSDGKIQGYIVIRAIVGRDPHEIEGGGVTDETAPPGGYIPRRVPLSIYDGGHIEYWLLEGNPADHNIQILSIKRLAKNSFKLTVGNQEVTVPVNPVPRRYDENFVRLLLESSGPTRHLESTMSVGQTQNLADVKVTVHQSPFDGRASLTFKAQDELGNSLGLATVFVSNQDYGRTKTIQIKSFYPDIRDGNFPSTDVGPEGPEVPPNPENPPGTMYRPSPGATNSVREVARFEITFTVHAGNPRTPGRHLPIMRN